MYKEGLSKFQIIITPARDCADTDTRQCNRLDPRGVILRIQSVLEIYFVLLIPLILKH